MNDDFMREAVACAKESVESGAGGPFGAVVVKDGEIVGRGGNMVVGTNDPTAHAEVVALRDACKRLGDFSLEGCELYASCEPCPMCLASIFWARIDKVYYACDRHDAARVGFDDAVFYEELAKPFEERRVRLLKMEDSEARVVMDLWHQDEGRREY